MTQAFRRQWTPEEPASVASLSPKTHVHAHTTFEAQRIPSEQAFTLKDLNVM